MRHIKNALFCFLLIYSTSACSQPGTNSIDDEIGQLLMIGFRGMSVDSTHHIYRDIKNLNLGGIILFDYDVEKKVADRNVKDYEQVKTLVETAQQINQRSLFVAIDQEGGRVNRLKARYGFPAIPSAAYLGELNNPDSTLLYYNQQSALLSELGFNVNFAPVVDVNTNPENPVIGGIDRSFSSDTIVVTQQAELAIQAYTVRDIAPVLKHFPGHGSSTKDSHLGIVDVTQTWAPLELSPYASLIKENKVSAIMTAHIFNTTIDPDWPATLSAKTIDGLLRSELGFDGVVFSDDMQMGAIRSEYGLETAIEQALNAGVDVLVFGNNTVYDPEIVPKAIAIIKKLLNEKKISEKRIKTSLERIAKLKESIR